MGNREQYKPELDQSKSQPGQAQQQQQPETGERQSVEGGERESFQTGQVDKGSAGDLDVEQRQDVETGKGQRQPETGEARDGFIGSQSEDERSDELIERDAE